MKIVLAEVPYTKDRYIGVEQSCCPEGAELKIAVFDEHSDDNSAFYKEIENADRRAEKVQNHLLPVHWLQ